jgi:2-polyprenyl-3-methyl-5-hydroxy-6-metoxy-1,4-benzoquinol methylase
VTCSGFDRAAERFNLAECCGCRLVSLSPLLGPAELTQYYSDDYYGGGVQGKFTPVMEAGVRSANRARAAELVAEWRASRRSASGAVAPEAPSSSGRVLDVGCGRAHLLTAMAQRGWECYGTELSAFPRDPRLQTPGAGRITVLRGALEDLPLEDAFFDVVSIWHVLEHVTNPSTTLQTIARILKPGGVLALAVPNYSSLQRIVFGRYWFHLDCPRHLYHFRKRLLLRWLDENGLAAAKVSTFSVEQNLFGFVQSALNVFFGRRRPNAFYHLLRRSEAGPSTAARTSRRILSLVGYAAIATALLPLAAVETAVAAGTGTGATLIVYARRTDREASGGAGRTQA